MSQTGQLEQARILVGFPAGGLTDAVARKLGDGIRGLYARNVLIENKPGASGRFVVDEVARGPADGSLMFLAPDGVMTRVHITSPKTTKYKYDELVAVSGISRLQSTLAIGPLVPDSIRTMTQFVAWAKANPDKASFGTPGNTSPQDFLMQLAMKAHGFEMRHIPYRGSAPGVQDLIGGQVPAMFSPVGDYLTHLKSGRVRLLGTTGEQRSRFVPDVPTFEELGYKGMLLTDWFGVWMKAGTPPATVERAHLAFRQALMQPGASELFDRFGMDIDVMPPEAFAKVIVDSRSEWTDQLQRAGYKSEE